ncbi:DUF3795 domain-containing protein [bacterium]|nr:DUF3795 domain-containing protein [FCB group bacterium]MBL7190542.1 DUF3795 domain-containing protein [bacterium]
MNSNDNGFSRRKFIKAACMTCAGAALISTTGCSFKLFGGKSNKEREKEMLGTLVGKCGIDCAVCPAYIATQENNEEKIKEIAGQWSEAFQYDVKPEDVWCDGCPQTEGRLSGFARQLCEARKCAFELKYDNCAYCPDFACAKLEMIYGFDPNIKTKMEEFRKSLKL